MPDESELKEEKELPSEEPIVEKSAGGLFSSNTFKIFLFFFVTLVLFVVIFALLYYQSTSKKTSQTSFKKVAKIVVVTTKTPVSPSASPSGALSPSPTIIPKLVILNGTRGKGVAASASARIRSQLDVSVVRLSNAQNIYTSSVIVDLTGKNGSTIGKITKVIGGQKSALPTGETKPTNADILIILGSDFK